jgi:hypothetical protein
LTHSTFSRRKLLRGFGSALALPLLESALPAQVALPFQSRPTRLVYLYVPNGVHLPDWWPEREGKLEKLPWILEPLQSFQGEFSVFGGLTSDKARANGDGPGDHARAAAVWLTAEQPLKKDGHIGLGVSADQIVAQSIGHQTRFRSLQLGCEKGGNAGQCDSGYSCAYSSNISWQGPETPASKEVNPRLVFDRLFRGGNTAAGRAASAARLKERKSLLDFVQEDARKLRVQLSNADGQKMDEYFSGIRELERRIAFAEKDFVAEVPDSARPLGRPADYATHVRLLMDLLVLALQTDRTRVATFLMANEGSNRSYRNLGIREGHHGISHHGNDAEKIEKIRRINRFHIEQLAYLLGRLQDTKDGAGNLLDTTMLVYGSNIGDGNRHNHHNLPTLLCGRGNGSLLPGSFKRYPDETPLANLHLALLDKMGVSAKTLGDSTGKLSL